jgi:hypothetical protein
VLKELDGRVEERRRDGATVPRPLLEVATSFRAELARTRRLLADPDTMGET